MPCMQACRYRYMYNVHCTAICLCPSVHVHILLSKQTAYCTNAVWVEVHVYSIVYRHVIVCGLIDKAKCTPVLLFQADCLMHVLYILQVIR